MALDKFGILKLYPTKTGGLEWFSNWNNGKTRYLKEGDKDPYDSRFAWTCGQPNVTLKIDGNGRAIVQDFTDSARLFVRGPWLNTEMTVYIYVPNSGKNADVQLRSRSNHEKQSGFGNYLVKWRGEGNDTASVEIEPMHPIYVRHLGEVALPKGLPKNKTIGFKQITRTIGNNIVRVEGYINYSLTNQSSWVKSTGFDFNGSNVPVVLNLQEPDRLACVDKGDLVANDLTAACLWLNQGQWCWIRTDGSDEVRYKYFSVREIVP